MSALARYADGLVEGTWLAAVVCVPLFVNRYSLRPFELNKVALLQALAMIALAAWLLRVVGERGARAAPADAPRPGRLPGWLMMAVGGLAVASLASTIGSVAPAISFLGSYDRGEGTCALLAYLALFAVMVMTLRDRPQVDRLVATIVAASLPVALYAVAQRVGIDPVPTDLGIYLGTSRVTSTLGNPVFLGAYLAMAWPLTMERIVNRTALTRNVRERHGTGGAWTILLFVLTGAAQLLAVVFAESRGPFLGLAVGSVGFSLIIAVRWRARRLVLCSLGVTLALTSLLIVAAAAGGPSRELGRVPMVSRLAEVLHPSRGSFGYRVEIWKMAPRLLTAREPVPYPGGSVDRWHRLRLLIGYGPETLPLVIRRLMTAPSGLTPDRFHNLIWDTLAAGGVAGLVATLGLMLGLFHSGLRRLGLIASPRQNAWFWASVAGGGGAGAIVAMSIYGSAASAAGFQLGLVAGQLAYLAGLLLPGTEAPTPGPLDQGDVLVAALWAGLIGHLAEVGFSFPVVATNILFWAYAALLQPTFAVAGDETEPAAGASSPRMRPRGRAPATSTSRHRRPPRAARPASWWWLPAIRDGAIVTIIVITMGFLLLGTLQPSSVRDVLGNALAMSRSGPGVSLLVALALVGVWVGAAMILAMSTSPEGSVRARSLGGMLLVSGLLGALYWTWLAVDLSGLSRQAIADGPSVLASAAGHARLFTNYCVWLLALLITFAAARSASGPAVPSRWTAPAVIAAPAMLGLALVAAWFVALRPAYADTIAATASSAHRAGLWEGAKLAYRRAIALAPDVEHYRVELGKVSFDQSRRAAGPRRDALLREAEQAWKDLHARGPLYWSYAPLASLYTTWALETSDASRRLELARRAEAQFARAVVLGPKDPDIWHSWAYLEWTLLGRPAEARAKDLRALELDPRFEPALALMGRYESSRWRERPGSEDGRQALRQAVRYYERAAAVTRNKYPHLMAMAEAQAALGEGERAIATYVSARPLASPPEVWKVDEALARLYASTGERDLARRHATLALQSAPPEARRRLESFLTRLR